MSDPAPFAPRLLLRGALAGLAVLAVAVPVAMSWIGTRAPESAGGPPSVRRLMPDQYRQIIADARLIPYLLPRMERSIAAAQALVAALDARSLATHRPVTRALAAEVLDTTAPE